MTYSPPLMMRAEGKSNYFMAPNYPYNKWSCWADCNSALWKMFQIVIEQMIYSNGARGSLQPIQSCFRHRIQLNVCCANLSGIAMHTWNECWRGLEAVLEATNTSGSSSRPPLGSTCAYSQVPSNSKASVVGASLNRVGFQPQIFWPQLFPLIVYKLF